MILRLVFIITITAIMCRADDGTLLTLAPGVIQAMSEAHDAHENLQKVQEIVKSIEEGQTPSITNNPYANLATAFKQAAADLRQGPLPTDFDDTPYRFSLDELRNCATRQASLEKGAQFLQELRAADDRGAGRLSDLDDALADVRQDRDALAYLIDVNGRLSQVPIYGEIFQWDWFELNTDVSNALADLTTALQDQENAIRSAREKLEMYIPNLQGNLNSLQSLPCSVDGFWNGQIRAGLQATPLSAQFINTRKKPTGELLVNASNQGPCEQLSITADGQIKFVVGDGPDQLKFTGTLKKDNSAMSGTFSGNSGSGTWSLARASSKRVPRNRWLRSFHSPLRAQR